MRIISKFKDYYDCIQKYGMDQNTLYIRNKIDIPDILISKSIKIPKEIGRLDSNTYLIDIKFDSCIVFFCGKVYKILKEHLYPTKYEKNQLYYQSHKNVYYNSYKEVLDNHQNINDSHKKIIFDYFKENNIVINLDFFRKFNSPIIQLDIFNHGSNLTVNPILRQIEFFKIVPPQEAYQKIYMFISGVLGNQEKLIPVISDELKAQSKGFNKWSFRKIGKNSKL